MIDRGAAYAATSLATGAVGVAASPEYHYAWIGQQMPMCIAVIMVVLVRTLIDKESKKKKSWDYNLLVMALCSIFAAVFVHEWHMTILSAMMFSIGVGATGVGIISYGKPFLASTIAKMNEMINGPSK